MKRTVPLLTCIIFLIGSGCSSNSKEQSTYTSAPIKIDLRNVDVDGFNIGMTYINVSYRAEMYGYKNSTYGEITGKRPVEILYLNKQETFTNTASKLVFEFHYGVTKSIRYELMSASENNLIVKGRFDHLRTVNGALLSSDGPNRYQFHPEPRIAMTLAYQESGPNQLSFFIRDETGF